MTMMYKNDYHRRISREEVGQRDRVNLTTAIISFVIILLLF
jgi:hypothetical protein